MTDDPMTSTVEPACVKWFRVYCWAMILLYLLLMVGGVVIALIPRFVDEDLGRRTGAILYAEAAIFFLLGAVFAVAHMFALSRKRTPGYWVFQMVMICFGLTSPCTLAAAVPLLLFWLRPETKAWYGRK